MEMPKKTSKTISTIAMLSPVKTIFEKRAATVEVDTSIYPAFVHRISTITIAMAMAMLPCLWRHHCVVTDGKVPAAHYRKLVGKENDRKGQKAIRVISKYLDGDAKTG